MAHLTDLSLSQLTDGLAAKAFSSLEVTRACLARAETQNPHTGAYLALAAGQALAQARAADALRGIKGSSPPPLCGVPLAVMDNICTEGLPTTCASKHLRAYRPPYSATVVRRLQNQGAVLLGKLNMDEFAMGFTGLSSAFGPVKNPVNPAHLPGGSSSGPAAAVVSCCAPFALGSDTGGSIRVPSSYCGAVGLRPTYGRVSRYGLVAFASSMDQIGPLTHNVEDAALALGALCGADPRDATSAANAVPDFADALQGGIAGLRIALPEEFLDAAAPAVGACVRHAATLCERLGARVEPIAAPLFKGASEACYILSSAEGASNLSRFDGVNYGQRAASAPDMDSLYTASRSEGFGSAVKRRILLGFFNLRSSAGDTAYQKAQRVRGFVRHAFERLFANYDFMLCPSTPTTAPHLDESDALPNAVLAGMCTAPASLAGLPALSLPGGRDADGLPIGLQLVGRAFEEAALLRAAFALEGALESAPAQLMGPPAVPRQSAAKGGVV